MRSHSLKKQLQSFVKSSDSRWTVISRRSRKRPSRQLKFSQFFDELEAPVTGRKTPMTYEERKAFLQNSDLGTELGITQKN